jgi:hypothetical protein
MRNLGWSLCVVRSLQKTELQILEVYTDRYLATTRVIQQSVERRYSGQVRARGRCSQQSQYIPIPVVMRRN